MINSMGFLNQINRTNTALTQSTQRLATGSKIPSVGYNPSGYAILTRMNSRLGATEQSNRNAQNANAMLKTAAGGVESTINALGTLKEKVLQAANDTNQPMDIDTINKTVNATIATIDANSQIEYNGMKLLDGSRNNVVVAGIDGNRAMGIGDMSAKGLGLVDENGKSLLDLYSRDGLTAALGSDKATAQGFVTDLVGQIDNALSRANAQKGALDEATDIGAMQQNLAFASANYTTQGEALTGSISTMGDADIAAEVTKFTSAKVQNQLALQAAKLHMHQNEGVLKLLQ